eukprot:8553111-Pyramimonas_sp.AAC.1
MVASLSPSTGATNSMGLPLGSPRPSHGSQHTLPAGRERGSARQNAFLASANSRRQRFPAMTSRATQIDSSEGVGE